MLNNILYNNNIIKQIVNNLKTKIKFLKNVFKLICNKICVRSYKYNFFGHL